MGLPLENLNLLLPPSELFKSNIISGNNQLPAFETIKKNDNISLSSLYTVKPSKKTSTNISLGLTDTPVSQPKQIHFSLGSQISVFGISPTSNSLLTKNVNHASTSISRLSGIPERNPYSMTGSEFIESTKGISRLKREKLILDEVLSGNIPDFARDLKEVNVSGKDKNGNEHTGKIYVMPDYLAIGSNDDFIRIPMDPLTAQKIANQTGTVLPTRKIVNNVYEQATVKLAPQPIKASPQMMSSEYYQHHNQLVEKQLKQLGATLGELTAGNKKDIVISNKVEQHPGRVAIYGWHQLNGKAIQPLSTVHENTYADYSHGVRLVSGTMIIDGEKKNIADVLKDEHQSWAISDEGKINNPGY
jgi:hypothetical protein